MPCICCPPLCNGPCETSGDCAEGCRCVDGECALLCSGPCETSEDCEEGCVCVDGQCVSEPPEPCSVFVDGAAVPISQFDPYEVITASWRGLQAPGRDVTYIDGVLSSDVPSNNDALVYITRPECSVFTQAVDGKTVFIGGGAGYINVCLTAEAQSQYQVLRTEVVNATTCRLSGGIGTLKVLTPSVCEGVASGDSILEENWWLWECLVVNGVPGDVTVSPLVGARYFNGGSETCGVTHEAPVVALDFVP